MSWASLEIETAVLRPDSHRIGIGAWAIGGGKWDTKGMNESAS